MLDLDTLERLVWTLPAFLSGAEFERQLWYDEEGVEGTRIEFTAMESGWEIESEMNTISEALPVLIAELRAARKVVQAAREWLEDWRGPETRGGRLEIDGEPEAAYRLVAALAELEHIGG